MQINTQLSKDIKATVTQYISDPGHLQAEGSNPSTAVTQITTGLQPGYAGENPRENRSSASLVTLHSLAAVLRNKGLVILPLISGSFPSLQSKRLPHKEQRLNRLCLQPER